MPGRVLVIAPNPDLRRSLAFALEAEGYVVTSRDAVLDGGITRGYDCVVLDHKAAAAASRDRAIAFCREAFPVVLLAGTPQPWLLPEVFEAVPTPVIADSLSRAVANAVATPGAPVRH